MPTLETVRQAPLAVAARIHTRLVAEDKEAGMTTAEYAVGTVAACGFGGVLYKVVTAPPVLEALKSVLLKAFRVTW